VRPAEGAAGSPADDSADDPAEELEGGFSRRAVAWIVGSVAVSFLAAVLLGVYGRDLESPRPGHDTFSYSALGHRGLAELLRAMGLGVVSRQSSHGGTPGPRRPLVLAEPDDKEKIKDLRDEAGRAEAPLVVVLPKRQVGPPDPRHSDWLASADLLAPEEVERQVAELGLGTVGVVRARGGGASCTASWGDAAAEPSGLRIVAAQTQLLRPAPGLAAVIACPGGVLIARLASGKGGPATYLIADPDILNNHGLDLGENAMAVFGFLTRGLGATGVVFDETIHGYTRVPGLLAEALRFPMGLATLQSLVLLGVVLWAGMGRFGKPLPPAAALAAGKAALIDNTAQLLAAGGHAADGLRRYFAQTTRAVAAHYFLPPDLPEGERLARLQQLTDGHAARSRRVRGLNLAALERSLALLPAGRRGEERAARIARRLYDWRLEMTNGHRD
jgi:hypothetical protein